MKVFKQREIWTGMPRPFHAVEKFAWIPGEKKLLVMHLTTFCDEVFTITYKGDKYEEYEKDVHRKKLCNECVRIIQLKLRSLKTRSDNLGTKSA